MRLLPPLQIDVEREADLFANSFLAPSCVLWGLSLRSAADIARICGLSEDAAEKRAARMAELYKCNEFLTSPLERKVYKRFAGFIEKNRL